ncbi:MAG: hypothetical protein Q9220_004901 [cf. Caloplaca sp. 1 TL-2023]
MAEEEMVVEGAGGWKQTGKDLFAGAAGGIAQTLFLLVKMIGCVGGCDHLGLAEMDLSRNREGDVGSICLGG